MADKRISQLVDRGTVANNDVVPIVVSGATTTNKATISSIQTFMQGNLDVGVTSVGITLGSTGTDVNVSGSPVTSSGNITINIPSASATNRGLVTTGAQTIAGAKTFNSDIIVNGVTVGKGGASNGNNTAIGVNALSSNTTGTLNTATGISALQFNTAGNSNTANGASSLVGNTTGGFNTAIGNQSLYSNTTGQVNTAIGLNSLYSNITGTYNTGIGASAGYYIADGSTPNTTSDFSIYLGADTKASVDNAQNEVVIGYNAIGSGSNTVTIGNSSTTLNKFFGATQSDTFRLPSDGGGNQVTIFENIGTIHQGTASINNFGFNNSNNIYFGKGLNNGGVIQFTNAAVRYYTLPDADGTIALTSDLSGYVTLGTAQTITAQKTFTGSGGSDTMIISHGSGSGFALDVIKAGNGEVMRVLKTSGSGNAMTVQGGNFEAPTIVKTGGTSAQFLMADGSVNTSVLASGAYLPLTGGTLTGALNGTSAVFSSTVSATQYTATSTGGSGLRVYGGSGTNQWDIYLNSTNLRFSDNTGTGNIVFDRPLNGTSAVFSANSNGVTLNAATGTTNTQYKVANTSGDAYFGIAASDGSSIFTGTTANSGYVGTNNNFPFHLATNGTVRLTLASTGAATFSSSVGVGGTNTDSLLTINGTAGTTHERFREGSTTIGFIGGANGIITGHNGKLAVRAESGLVLSGSGNSPDFIIASGGAATFSSSVTANGRLQVISGFADQIRFGTNTSVYTNISMGTGFTVFDSIGGDAGAYDFRDDGQSRLFINSSGNVGIGTSSPNFFGYGSGVTVLSLAATASDRYSAIELVGNRGIGENQNGNIDFVNNNGTATVTSRITALNGASSVLDGILTFHTRTSAGSLTERMRITSGGFTKARANGGSSFGGGYHEFVNNNNVNGDICLVIGNVAGSNTNNTSSKHLIVADSAADRLYIYGNGNVVNVNNSYGSLSDIKLKENIEDATPKLDDLMKVKVRNYNLIGDDKKQIGVIAQELEEVFPAMIDESEDYEDVEVPQVDEEGNEILNEEGEVVTKKQIVSKGTTTKSVKYSVFVPMLIKAMQEQQEQIKSLTEQIDSLKNQIK